VNKIENPLPSKSCHVHPESLLFFFLFKATNLVHKINIVDFIGKTFFFPFCSKNETFLLVIFDKRFGFLNKVKVLKTIVSVSLVSNFYIERKCLNGNQSLQKYYICHSLGINLSEMKCLNERLNSEMQLYKIKYL